MTARSDVYAYARVETLPSARLHVPGERVQTLTSDGVVVARAAQPSVLLPFASLRSLGTYDHLRGARDGALVLGLPALVIGGVFGALLNALRSNCSDGCGDRHDPVPLVFGMAGLFGLCGALLGGGVGALAGHEDRYLIAPE